MKRLFLVLTLLACNSWAQNPNVLNSPDGSIGVYRAGTTNIAKTGSIDLVVKKGGTPAVAGDGIGITNTGSVGSPTNSFFVTSDVARRGQNNTFSLTNTFNGWVIFNSITQWNNNLLVNGSITTTNGIIDTSSAGIITAGAITLNPTNGNVILTGSLQWPSGNLDQNLYTGSGVLTFPAGTALGQVTTNTLTVTGAIPFIGMTTERISASVTLDPQSVWMAQVTATNVVSIFRTHLLNGTPAISNATFYVKVRK